jgi:acyl-lipid omega-6 desaturase (Delta-12 desaturase)
LQSAVRAFERPSLRTGLFQLSTSIGLFIGVCAAMYWSLQLSYFLTLLLAIPAGALLVRVFIVQHDCGHGSFFASRRANDLMGTLCSVFTLTPYANWRRQHAAHHANWNNLDKRASGRDIYSVCLTVKEYREMTRWQRLAYRVSRHPLIAHVLIPPMVFLVLYRVPFDTPKDWNRERHAVYWTDLALFLLLGSLGLAVGFKAVLMVQLPILIVTSIIGVGLFAIQHRFDHSLWARQPEWRFGNAALRGSSYLKLPKLLQWFTGNIGFHNVHHLAPRVPNYRLESCYRANPQFQADATLSLGDAYRAIRLALWDEDREQLVGFRELRRI